MTAVRIQALLQVFSSAAVLCLALACSACGGRAEHKSLGDWEFELYKDEEILQKAPQLLVVRPKDWRRDDRRQVLGVRPTSGGEAEWREEVSAVLREVEERQRRGEITEVRTGSDLEGPIKQGFAEFRTVSPSREYRIDVFVSDTALDVLTLGSARTGISKDQMRRIGSIRKVSRS